MTNRGRPRVSPADAVRRMKRLVVGLTAGRRCFLIQGQSEIRVRESLPTVPPGCGVAGANSRSPHAMRRASPVTWRAMSRGGRCKQGSLFLQRRLHLLPLLECRYDCLGDADVGRLRRIISADDRSRYGEDDRQGCQPYVRGEMRGTFQRGVHALNQ